MKTIKYKISQGDVRRLIRLMNICEQEIIQSEEESSTISEDNDFTGTIFKDYELSFD